MVLHIPGTAPAAPIKPASSGILADVARRVLIFGPPGVGKSTLASMCCDDPVVLDLDNETPHLPIRNRVPIASWAELRKAVQSASGTRVVLDNLSKAEAMCVQHVVANVPKEKGGVASNIESYGFGKGYRHVYDEWMCLLADFDRLTERKIWCVLIAHEIVETVPNPEGDDFIRYEPRLQKQKSGPIQSRTIEWCSDVFYLGYDVAAIDGKGRGIGTRTIYGKQRPTWIAKSRPARADLPWNDPTDNTFWKQLQ